MRAPVEYVSRMAHVVNDITNSMIASCCMLQLGPHLEAFQATDLDYWHTGIAKELNS